MAFISENIISEGNLSGNTLNVGIATITTQLVTPKISINGGLSADTITLTTTPTSNASATQILSRNSTTGVIEYRDYSTFTGGGGGTLSGDTYVTGFTYSNNNLTISQNGGQLPLSVTINNFTGLTVNGGLSATTIFLITTPTLNNSNTEILTLNTTTNQIEVSDSTSTSIYNYGVSFAMSTSNFLT